MPVPDQVRDDGSGIQCPPGFRLLSSFGGLAGMTTLMYLVAGVIILYFDGYRVTLPILQAVHPSPFGPA